MKPNELIGNRQTHKGSGIYLILCVSVNKGYVGQSKNIRARWDHHKGMLRRGIHKNPYLQRLYDKYGKDSFLYIVLENGEENLSEREAYYLSQIDEDCRINLNGIIDVIPTSEETRAKQSESAKRRGSSWIGRKHSEESKKRMAEAAKNRSPEIRKKIIESIKEAKSGKPAWNKGLKKERMHK